MGCHLIDSQRLAACQCVSSHARSRSGSIDLSLFGAAEFVDEDVLMHAAPLRQGALLGWCEIHF